METTLIFSVDIADASQKIVNIKNEIASLKKVQQDQLAELEKSNELTSQAYEQTAAELKNLADEQRLYQRLLQGQSATIKNNTDTVNFNNNSIKQNRDLLKQLTAEYINLRNPTKAQTAEIKRLSDELKKQESAIGNNTRNVGNYKDALQGLGGGIGTAVQGVTGFNAALKANPIIAVVGLLITLSTQLSKNEKVFEAAERVVSGFNGALQFIVDTVVDTISSFDNLGKALRNPIKFIKELATGTRDAAKASFEATGALQQIEDAERELAKSIALTNTEIEKQKNLQTSGKTLAERQAAAKKVIELAEQVRDAELKFARERVSALQKLSDANRGNEDLQQQLTDAIVKREELEQNFYASTRKSAKLANEQIQENINLIATYEKTFKDLEKTAKDGLDVIEEESKDLGDIVRPQIENIAVAIDKIPTALERAQENFEGFQINLQDSSDKIQEGFAIALTGLDTISLATEARIQTRIGDLREQTELEVERINQLAITEEEKEKKIAQVREKALKKEEQLERQAARNQKAIQSIQAGISGALAIIQSLANTTLPFPASLAAPVAIGAVTAANIALINRQQFAEGGEVPIMAEGGRAYRIKGKSHAQGGEDVHVGGRRVANIEGGEGMFIMKKTAFNAINKFSNINKAFGGRSWTKGTTTHAADGGQLNATIPILDASTNVNNQIAQSQLIAEAMKNIPAPMLSLTELDKRQSQLNKSVRVSEL